jgi:hypothetical protein
MGENEVTAALQDGNREWVTVLAAVCADSESLPPGLIYAATSGTLQSTWVANIKAGKYDVIVTTYPLGWSNNDVGLAWLEQVYDRCTKQKARRGRDYRLLIVGGHGSHLVMDFINCCDAHRILLAILPPHSTHTLQPHDVVILKLLSSSYSNEPTSHIHRSQGLVPIQKSNFFLLFWRAWRASFRKELVIKSFEATGIWPMERDNILQRFNSTAASESENAPAEAS